MDYGEGPKSPGTNPERSTPELATSAAVGILSTLYLVCHCGSSTIFANSQIILPQACYQFMT